MASKPETKKLTFAEYAAMAAADLFKLAAETAVKPVEALTKAKDKIVGQLHAAAKVVAAMKRLYTSRVENREIPGDTTFKKYFKDNAGGDLPGRVEALASLFNSLVLTVVNGKPLITEEIFDDAAVDWLEKASAIVNAAQKQHGEKWMGCDEVLDMLNALTKPGDAAKKLKEIRKRQKGEATGEGADGENAAGKSAAVVVTPQLAAEYLIAAIKNAHTLPTEQAAALFALTCQVNDTWAESGIADDSINAWAANIANGVAPHLEIVRDETREAVAA